jgi:polyisoprenoid-binding protein YceI
VPKIAKVLLIAVVALAVLVPAGTYTYIHFIRDDAPERLSFDTSTTTATSAPGGGTTGSSPTSSVLPTNLDGTWQVTSASQVGYRVKEKLFGQDTEAVGRTNSVTGSLQYSGQKVSTAKIVVDMASVKSDQNNRDNQFRGRIMDTATHPNAVFELTEPIDLPRPPETDPFTVKATGNLTLRGVTQSVQVDLKIRQNGDTIEANGSIPITFSKWSIPNPSFGPAETEDNGELELLVSFRHQ